jgi:hypothetical protein
MTDHTIRQNQIAAARALADLIAALPDTVAADLTSAHLDHWGLLTVQTRTETTAQTLADLLDLPAPTRDTLSHQDRITHHTTWAGTHGDHTIRLTACHFTDPTPTHDHDDTDEDHHC